MFDFPLNPVDYLHRAGRTGRAGRKGLVTSVITKRDVVLSNAISGAIARRLPIDSLTSTKKDYQDKGKHARVVGKETVEGAARRAQRKKELFGDYKDMRATKNTKTKSAFSSGKRAQGDKYVRVKPGPQKRTFNNDVTKAEFAEAKDVARGIFHEQTKDSISNNSLKRSLKKKLNR